METMGKGKLVEGGGPQHKVLSYMCNSKTEVQNAT
jgi:hypothetical protein